MRKWEVKYNELKSGNLDQDIQQLKQKVEQKSATREEYKEYNKLLKIKDNMPKIANILEYKGKISEEITKIEKELEALKKLEYINENSEKLNNTSKVIDAKMNKISEEKLNIEKQLKNTKLTKEQREELLSKNKELDKEMANNNQQYVKLQKILEGKTRLENQTPSASREDLENRKNELLQKRSKCNLVGRNLVEGLSWNSIEMNLDKWKDRTFTAKKAQTKDAETVETRTEETHTGEEQEENLPAKVSVFAKIKNKISNLVKNIFKSRNKEKTVEIDNDEVTKPEESEKTERDDFTKYLREVAEKGYKEVNKEEAMKKLEELKKEAYKRETEKYGEEYAKRSMKQEDNER